VCLRSSAPLVVMAQSEPLLLRRYVLVVLGTGLYPESVVVSSVVPVVASVSFVLSSDGGGGGGICVTALPWRSAATCRTVPVFPGLPQTSSISKNHPSLL